jgi:hypothetical protein
LFFFFPGQLKIHFQSNSAQSIAVGHQHKNIGTIRGLQSLYVQYGVVRGLWRGATGAMVRIGVASAMQLSTMGLMNEALVKHGLLTNDQKVLCTLVSSMLGGILMAVVMAPFDLVSTRLYNQGRNSDRDKWFQVFLRVRLIGCASKRLHNTLIFMDHTIYVSGLQLYLNNTN